MEEVTLLDDEDGAEEEEGLGLDFEDEGDDYDEKEIVGGFYF